MSITFPCQGSGGSLLTWGSHKPWHKGVTEDLRHLRMHELVETIFLISDPKLLMPVQMKDVVVYTGHLEGSLYRLANSKEEYDLLLDQRIYRIQKKMEGLRRYRLERVRPNT